MMQTDAQHFTRVVGRRLIDLTGNGPPTRTERLKQKLHLAPRHPTYSIVGRTFISSHPKAGNLSIYIPAPTNAPGILDEACMVETFTGVETNETGADGDVTVFIDADLLGPNLTGAWTGLTPNEAARRTARIGRHLAYAEFATTPNRRMGHDHLLLCDAPKVANLAVYLLAAALIYNGMDHLSPILEIRSPNHNSNIIFPECDAMLSPSLAELICISVQPRLTVKFFEKSLIIRRDRLNIDVSDMPVVDRIKLVRHASDLLERSGMKVKDLLFTSKAGELCPKHPE